MRVRPLGLILTALILTASPWPAAPLAGQEPVPDTTGALPADTLEATPPDTTTAPAPRRPYVPPRLAVSLSAGTLGFDHLQNQPVMAVRLGEGGARVDSAGLDRRLAAEDGLQATVSALLGLSRAWAIRGAVTWGSATLASGYAGEEAFETDAAGLPHAASPDLSVLAVEGALRFRMLSGRRMQPFAEVGAAAVRLAAEDTAFPGAAGLTGETSMAGLVALGAIIPIRGALAARVQATGHWFGTPAGPAPAGVTVATGDTLEVRFLAPLPEQTADPVREMLRTVRLDFGLSIELGSAVHPRAAAVGPRSGSRP